VTYLTDDKDSNIKTWRELEQALLDTGYSERVKDAIIGWYSKH
jgi:hypothetical protein